MIALGRLGWPLRRIEEATGVRRETVGEYLRRAGVAIRPVGSWGERSLAKAATSVTTGSGEEAANPAIEVTTGFFTGKTPAQCSASSSEPYREWIAQQLERGRNAMGIWQDLVDVHGFSGGYQSVKRFVRSLRGSSSPEARVIIETAPGEECQVDFGTGPMVRDAETGKYRRTRLFVMTLGYSRKSVRLFVFRSSVRAWAELHEKAFRRLGGSPSIVVLDNLREGVLAADIYDPKLSPLYRDVLAHYGVTALPCRVRDPDRKGKVESGVAHAQKTPLKGKRFESLEEAQSCFAASPGPLPVNVGGPDVLAPIPRPPDPTLHTLRAARTKNLHYAVAQRDRPGPRFGLAVGDDDSPAIIIDVLDAHAIELARVAHPGVAHDNEKPPFRLFVQPQRPAPLLEESELRNLANQFVLLGLVEHTAQRPQCIVSVRGRAGKRQLLDLVLGDFVHALAGDLRLLEQPPAVAVITAGVRFQAPGVDPLEKILGVFLERRWLSVQRVAALNGFSEFKSGNLLRPGFAGLLGGPAIALAAHREVVPVVL